MVLERLWGESPHPRAKEKSQQDGRRGEITFRIKPHTCQRCSEGPNMPCSHQDPETPQRLSQNCVWVSPVSCLLSPCLPQGQGLWVHRTGYGRVQQTWGWHKPSWRRSPLTARTYTGLRKQTLGGTDRTLCAPGPRRKEQRPHKRLTRRARVQEPLVEAWSAVACCRPGGRVQQWCVRPLEAGRHYLHFLHHSLA